MGNKIRYPTIVQRNNYLMVQYTVLRNNSSEGGFDLDSYYVLRTEIKLVPSLRKIHILHSNFSKQEYGLAGLGTASTWKFNDREKFYS